ncbi:MAG: phosphotransferase [Eudoraea sp.]|nr:phosphotransferase [Eudoraea sp.]
MIEFDLDTPLAEIQEYLNKRNWLFKNEKILSAGKPGEGNMNVVIRLVTNQRSFILKQSRPFVQKYQQIPAPLDRIEVEFNFYKAVDNVSIAPHIPKILGYEAADYLLMMEDLGKVEDMTQIYSDRAIPNKILDHLIAILTRIHASETSEDYPLNTKLRALNHQHIFILPFLEDNGFELDDIQPGLQTLSLPYKKDEALKEIVETIGRQYLAPGNILIHGDYYPGSWMTVDDRVYVIDPEFSFKGFAEFDLGVMAAHTIMASMDLSLQEYILSKYPFKVDPLLVKRVSGIEIIRRMIGLAQLPIIRSIPEKDYLLQIARKLILG